MIGWFDLFMTVVVTFGCGLFAGFLLYWGLTYRGGAK